MCIATEIVTMKSVSNITKDEFISIVDGLEKDFHSKQLGFIDTELLYDEQNNLWVMIQHWESREQLKAASQKMFKDSAAEFFVKSLHPESVKMTIAPQIKTWG
nr:antibiotic biosynthesis monooxygenase [uncultured Aminipila sp.]